MSSFNDKIENLKNNTTHVITQNSINQNSSINKLEEFLNNKVVNMYSRPWQKLENSLKITKMKEYLKSQELDELEYNKQLNILISAINTKKLKTSNITYNEELCKIETLKYKF